MPINDPNDCIGMRPVEYLISDEVFIGYYQLPVIPVSNLSRADVNTSHSAAYIPDGDNIANAYRALKLNDISGYPVYKDLLQAKRQSDSHRNDQPQCFRPANLNAYFIMLESLTNTAQKAGMSPGTLVHVGSALGIEPSMWLEESIESHRDMLSGLLDIYISAVSNWMNEIMKVLIAFASIFIPLTFIAVIYGINFEYMPELRWKWAYPALWLLFILIPMALIIYFKRKSWL